MFLTPNPPTLIGFTIINAKATVNEIHVSGQGITMQLVRAGSIIIHYDDITACKMTRFSTRSENSEPTKFLHRTA